MVKRVEPLRKGDQDRAGAPRKAAGKAGTPKSAARKSGVAAGSSPPETQGEDSKPPTKRREQQRAIDTRQAILRAALSEFAERGFEAASIRNIGTRTGLQHPLITYHFRTKEILWKAVAENAFEEIRKLWDEATGDDLALTPLEALRTEYSSFLRFTLNYPDFHHFMLRESRPGNPRLPWLVETILMPTMQRLISQIEGAQARQELPPGNPILIHYMLIGITSVLSSFKDEIHQTAGVVTDDPQVVDSYLGLIDALIFRPGRLAAPPAPPAPTPTKKAPRAAKSPKAV